MNRYSSGSIIGWIIGIILFCIFEPVIYFGLAYFGGWIMQMCIGTTIATIGSFFKTRVSSNSSK